VTRTDPFILSDHVPTHIAPTGSLFATLSACPPLQIASLYTRFPYVSSSSPRQITQTTIIRAGLVTALRPHRLAPTTPATR
jgi:hypothetical protein